MFGVRLNKLPVFVSCYWVHSLCLDFCLKFICPLSGIVCLSACSINVTWWREPGQIESYLDD